MKKVIVVSKTHLDLGFTDYAYAVREKYLKDFIPSAIAIAKAVNTRTKRFVWTTGSWLLSEALKNGTPELKSNLTEALKNGDICAHALPFTTHTELLDADTLEYGLSLIDKIDKISGTKTISAKMTDVPGHTAALVPFLARKGIKLLHIGVNGASAIPVVPECFLWKKDGYEIVVIYSGDYGGEFRSCLIDDILYFDHTLDNHGVRSPEAVIGNFNAIQEKYKGFEVVAGSMDYIAEKLWSVKDRLPVITSEIGDSWIHGAASDPYKVAALKELQSLKREWLDSGSLVKNSAEYNELDDNLLCICEHTWGMDMKTYLGDYEHYLRKDFEKARKRDKVRITRIFADFPHNFNNFVRRLKGEYKVGSYRVIEKSWQEQREYIKKAVGALSKDRAKKASERLARLTPQDYLREEGKPLECGKTYSFGSYRLCINSFGGIGSFAVDNVNLIKDNNRPVMQYHSYGIADYNFWFDHYTRDAAKNKNWAFSDFGRPLLKYADKGYLKGRFDYRLESSTIRESKQGLTISVMLRVDDYCSSELGAPKRIQLIYTVDNDGLNIRVIWISKPASRLTESLHFNLYPNAKKESLFYQKIGADIDPYKVVKYGNRNLSAVERIKFTSGASDVCIVNSHAPLVGLGKGKILEFDNKYGNVEEEGLSFILHNNVWGTNFPLWYEGNAAFDFAVKVESNKRQSSK